MNILVGIGHPAHVHFFKNAIRIWEDSGYKINVAVRDNEIAGYLLDMYEIKYEILRVIRGYRPLKLFST